VEEGVSGTENCLRSDKIARIGLKTAAKSAKPAKSAVNGSGENNMLKIDTSIARYQTPS
jgi:hypothetical protein